MSPDVDVLDRMLDPVRTCLTPEVASRIAALRADPVVQQRLDELAAKNSAATISEAERSELEAYVGVGALISVLQAKARTVLAEARRK
jgi:hypothetical protein